MGAARSLDPPTHTHFLTLYSPVLFQVTVGDDLPIGVKSYLWPKRYNRVISFIRRKVTIVKMLHLQQHEAPLFFQLFNKRKKLSYSLFCLKRILKIYYSWNKTFFIANINPINIFTENRGLIYEESKELPHWHISTASGNHTHRHNSAQITLRCTSEDSTFLPAHLHLLFISSEYGFIQSY